jgi:ribosomal-protein-alanine acetyltransferase
MSSNVGHDDVSQNDVERGGVGHDEVKRSGVSHDAVSHDEVERSDVGRSALRSVAFPQVDGAAFREMSWRDLPQVLGIENESFPEDAWSPAQFWSELAQADSHKHYAVVVDDEDVFAYAGVQILAPEAEILTIAVHPEVRGRGYGRALVTYLENTAAMNRCTTMHLEVATDNDSAHQLYLALGYADIGVRANYYGTGRDALMMSKQLQVGA